MYKNHGDWYEWYKKHRFNPCFNGSMYKNFWLQTRIDSLLHVSILVLMDLCIKTIWEGMGK